MTHHVKVKKEEKIVVKKEIKLIKIDKIIEID